MAVEATRERIIDAVHALLAEESPATLSIPAVADRAGTSLRTVYRYFPTKEALVDAASRTFEEQTHGVSVQASVGTLEEYLVHVWTRFTKSLGAVKAQHVTPAGRELRDARLPRSRAGARLALQEEGLDLPDEDLDRLADLIVVLIGSSMYLELVDRLGYDETDAARLAAWATTAIVDRARREGTVAP